MTKHYTVKSVSEAWSLCNELFPSDYEYDSSRSHGAGYPTYGSTSAVLPHPYYNYVCDLGDRLELNLVDEEWNGTTINIWIDEEEEPEAAASTAAEPEETRVDVLGVPAVEISCKWYVVTLSTGKQIDVLQDVSANGSSWAYSVAGQYFSEFSTARAYLHRIITESITGVRVLPYQKGEVPMICGVNGRACRCPGKCNSALCYHCPIADEFSARKDGVSIVYAF